MYRCRCRRQIEVHMDITQRKLIVFAGTFRQWTIPSCFGVYFRRAFAVIAVHLLCTSVTHLGYVNGVPVLSSCSAKVLSLSAQEMQLVPLIPVRMLSTGSSMVQLPANEVYTWEKPMNHWNCKCVTISCLDLMTDYKLHKCSCDSLTCLVHAHSVWWT